MNDPVKLLVATECSEHTPGLVDFALDVTGALHAKLIVISVINARDVKAVASISAMGYEVDGEHYIEGVREERRRFITALLEAAGVPIETARIVIPVGHPIDEILKLAVKESVDMIVMGVKGRTDLARFYVGSVAEKVFRRSPVPVLSYRDAETGARLKKRIPAD